ncbi:hypothetical protein MW887_001179 [Aspergillus wentii]|nr:hypothetical protein MW887_001179 [Aspergillus wentii]
MPYTEFHTRRTDASNVTLLDTNGAILYKTDYSGLLLKIVQLNDMPILKRYIAKHLRHALAPDEAAYYDPFWVAATHGSTDALRLLLNHYKVDAAQSTQPLNERGYLLLNVACRYAQLETVRFLLDSQTSLNIHDRDGYGKTALLCATDSLVYLVWDGGNYDNVRQDWISDRIDRGEELINLLLDMGASARDAITINRGQQNDEDRQAQPVDTVAISHASYK